MMLTTMVREIGSVFRKSHIYIINFIIKSQNYIITLVPIYMTYQLKSISSEAQLHLFDG